MIRVIIADDHALVREGIKRLIDSAPDMQCVGEAETGEQALTRVAEVGADVLTLDLSLPGRSGLDVLLHLHSQQPALRVLVISMLSERDYAIRALRAGASGFLTKGARAQEILEAIRKLSRGERHIPASVSEQLLDSPSDAPHELLSSREFDVLVALAQGKPPGVIAQELGLAPSTVSTYTQRIRVKLGLETLGEVIQYAVRRGIVP